MRNVTFLVLLFCLLAGCSRVDQDTVTNTITIQYTTATTPWLSEMAYCAIDSQITLIPELRTTMSFQPMHGSLLMHVGYIDNGYPQYEVGTTRLVIVTNSDNPVKQISFDQVQAIFTGRINNWSAISGENANVQVWIFPGGDDIQMIFQESVLEGIPISTSARVATTAGEMSTAISLDPNAIGIITRQTLPDNVTVSLELVDLPVLVTLMNEPDALTLDLIDCMQKQP